MKPEPSKTTASMNGPEIEPETQVLLFHEFSDGSFPMIGTVKFHCTCAESTQLHLPLATHLSQLSKSGEAQSQLLG